MAMQWTMSLSSSVRCYVYPHNRFIATPSSVAARKKLVISQRQPAFSISSKSQSLLPLEVVDDLDCLPNPKTPWLMIGPEIDLVRGRRAVEDSFYSPVEHRVVRLNRKDCLGVPETAVCFASTGEWLGFVDPNPKDDCPVYLTNPYMSDKDMSVIRLPSLATLPEVLSIERDPETGCTLFNLVDSIDTVSDLSIDSCKFPFEAEWFAGMISHLSISNFDPRQADCVVTALQGEPRKLAYCRIWDDPKTSLGWIGLQEDYLPDDICNQVVFSNTLKLFYTINGNGIEVFDLFRDRKKRSKKVCVFTEGQIEANLRHQFEQEENKELKELRKVLLKTYHLVMLDDNGKSSDLVLVVRHFSSNLSGIPHEQTLHFDVFKVDFERRILVRLKTLEERCIFVGPDQSFSLCSTKYPGLHPNCIYFIDTQCSYLIACKLHNDRGIFHLNDNKIDTLSCPFTQPPWRGCEKLFWISPSNIINI